MAPRLFFILLVPVCFLITKTCNGNGSGSGTSSPKFPALLIFGDSIVDPGNNNYINTIVKSNHQPYGLDFPGKVATGRFSNGKLVTDFLASMLGIKESVPPFLDPYLSDDELHTGVSFASAGSGYDDLTTVVSGAIPLSKQVGYLKMYIQKLQRIVGEEKARSLINASVVAVVVGTNDFVFNFYDIPTRRLHFDISGYQDFVQNRLQSFVKELYNLGCRIIAVSGLPPIGCLPIQMTLNLQPPILRTCLQDQNSDAQSYNQKLTKMLPQLQALLPGSKIVYADIYEPINDMIYNPQKYGFEDTKRGCCGTGLLEGGTLCTPITPLCANRSRFLFFDSVHPGESAYRYAAEYIIKEIIPKLSDIGRF
uniref:GDSL esterase/lipase n=1 Tax=Davidia involucrata TaxID=16924 RepID=A0A5B6YNI8_DAVIN